MSRVFIIGPGKHDYSPAATHGELIRVMEHKCNPFNTDSMVQDAANILFDAHHATVDDALLFCGNPYLNACVVALFMKKFGRFKMLVYGAKHHDYAIRDVEVHC